jgi:stage III sporulation protein AB
MKWMGAILLIIASTSIGLVISNRLEKRPKHIRQLESALQLLEAEITYSQSPLHIAFQKIGSQLPEPVSQFFIGCSTDLQSQDGNFLTHWEKRVDELAAQASYKKAEIEVLKQFGHSLGQHDFIQQQKQIRLALTHLARELEEARDEYSKYSKLARNLGVLVGVFIVLLLI